MGKIRPFDLLIQTDKQFILIIMSFDSIVFNLNLNNLSKSGVLNLFNLSMHSYGSKYCSVTLYKNMRDFFVETKVNTFFYLVFTSIRTKIPEFKVIISIPTAFTAKTVSQIKVITFFSSSNPIEFFFRALPEIFHMDSR